MTGLRELISMVPAVAAIVSLAVHSRLANRSGSDLFAYGLIIALVIAAATIAISLAPSDHDAQAITDAGVLMAGVLSFAASRWLIFAFGMAGDAGDR
jgi:hypothetical protein